MTAFQILNRLAINTLRTQSNYAVKRRAAAATIGLVDQIPSLAGLASTKSVGGIPFERGRDLAGEMVPPPKTPAVSRARSPAPDCPLA